jgi:hypothetical protein
VTESRDLKRALTQDGPWDVLHSINLGRWADQIPCLEARRRNPRLRWVVSSVLVDYGAYDAQRVPGVAQRQLGPEGGGEQPLLMRGVPWTGQLIGDEGPRARLSG